MPRVLHVLSQRPSLTGSGVTLGAFVRHAAAAGWEQDVVVGVPADDAHPDVGGLPRDRVHPLTFDSGGLDFPVPGMSDVMPYRSTRFSAMTAGQLDAYRAAWMAHLRRVVDRVRPDLIHSHHLWIVSSLLEDVAPDTPIVTQCHATGFRQMELCPQLRDTVATGCARNDRFLALHTQHAAQIATALSVPLARVHVVGAGYRDELFHARGRTAENWPRLLYVGKYSAAKGLPWLLDSLEGLGRRTPGLELHVAGSGAGFEADALRSRMRAMRPAVTQHGQLTQGDLGDLMRRSAACVLPSFYEGLPLVLVEALACGCRLVATDLSGIREHLAPHLGKALELVPLPRLEAVDTPVATDRRAFVGHLEAAIGATLARPPLGDPDEALPGALEPFRWSSVFSRVEAVWKELVG